MRQVLKLFNKNCYSLVCKNQNGQSMVEYLLLLIVIVSILLSFKGLFTGAEKFMYKYMGDYVSCLMEYGELPALGVSNSDLKNQSGSGGGKVCDSKFDGFTIENGRQAKTNPSNSSSSSSNRSDASKQNSKNSSQPSDSKSSSSSDGQSAGSGGSGRRSSPYTSGKIARSGAGARISTGDGAKAFNEDDKVKVLEDTSAQGRGDGSNESTYGSTRIRYEKVRYKAIAGNELANLNDKLSRQRTPSTKTLKTIDYESGFGPRKNTINPPERKIAAAVEQKDESYSFGNFLKWLIIIGIGISIFLFFGSQVMSFLNSQEK